MERQAWLVVTPTQALSSRPRFIVLTLPPPGAPASTPRAHRDGRDDLHMPGIGESPSPERGAKVLYQSSGGDTITQTGCRAVPPRGRASDARQVEGMGRSYCLSGGHFAP